MLELQIAENGGDLEWIEAAQAAITELKSRRLTLGSLQRLVLDHGWSLRAIGPQFIMLGIGAARGAPKQAMHTELGQVIRAANFLQNGGNPR